VINYKRNGQLAEEAPETGMSYQIATIYLKDGRAFKQVLFFVLSLFRAFAIPVSNSR
jgi:hypothetical protein